jgi:hypothetical protein
VTLSLEGRTLPLIGHTTVLCLGLPLFWHNLHKSSCSQTLSCHHPWKELKGCFLNSHQRKIRTKTKHPQKYFTLYLPGFLESSSSHSDPLKRNCYFSFSQLPLDWRFSQLNCGLLTPRSSTFEKNPKVAYKNSTIILKSNWTCINVQVTRVFNPYNSRKEESFFFYVITSWQVTGDKTQRQISESKLKPARM